MLYKEIEDKLLNDDYSKKNIRDIIKKLKNNDIDNDKFEEYVLDTKSCDRAVTLSALGVILLIIFGIALGLLFMLTSVFPFEFLPIALGISVLFIPSTCFRFMNITKVKKKVLGMLRNDLNKIKDQEKQEIAKLDRESLNIEDNNVKMIYSCARVINKIKYEGWENDLDELQSLYKEYMDIQVKRKLTKEPMLSARELEIGARIGELSSKLELIQFEFSLRNNPFLKKVYIKITELKKLDYNGVQEHIVLLNNLVDEYVLYKRTVPVNDKADFDEEEMKKEAEFEKKFDNICYLINVYQTKDQNDKILGSMFDIARGTKFDDSAVNLDVGLDNDTTLGLRKKL